MNNPIRQCVVLFATSLFATSVWSAPVQFAADGYGFLNTDINRVLTTSSTGFASQGRIGPLGLSAFASTDKSSSSVEAGSASTTMLLSFATPPRLTTAIVGSVVSTVGKPLVYGTALSLPDAPVVQSNIANNQIVIDSGPAQVVAVSSAPIIQAPQATAAPVAASAPIEQDSVQVDTIDTIVNTPEQVNILDSLDLSADTDAIIVDAVVVGDPEASLDVTGDVIPNINVDTVSGGGGLPGLDSGPLVTQISVQVAEPSTLLGFLLAGLIALGASRKRQ